MLGIKKIIFRENVPAFVWRKNGKPFLKTTFSTPDRELNLNLPVIGSLVNRESSALDHMATEAGGVSNSFGDVAGVDPVPLWFDLDRGQNE
uniref:Uncharacterized protein n=1 Tax=Timema cristinae TaxID=61476 RepID=A0A7R9C9P1_TIMCR|nr:unnamed protein product [Timema cristinae]